jgi:hypothetical protein
VVLGGSRARGTHGPDSDWDLGLYYRAADPVEPAAVRGLGRPGFVSALGEWGPVMNGGGWLRAGAAEVDVLFRELGAVEHAIAEAAAGRFEILQQNGALAGAPSYQLAGELALGRPIHGAAALPQPADGRAVPAALRAAAPARWEGRAAVSLLFADAHAGAGDVVACAGTLAHAVLCAAHARVVARGAWALGEKRLVADAGFEGVAARMAAPGESAAALRATVAAVAEAIGVEPLRTR